MKKQMQYKAQQKYQQKDSIAQRKKFMEQQIYKQNLYHQQETKPSRKYNWHYYQKKIEQQIKQGQELLSLTRYDIQRLTMSLQYIKKQRQRKHNHLITQRRMGIYAQSYKWKRFKLEDEVKIKENILKKILQQITGKDNIKQQSITKIRYLNFQYDNQKIIKYMAQERDVKDRLIQQMQKQAQQKDKLINELIQNQISIRQQLQKFKQVQRQRQYRRKIMRYRPQAIQESMKIQRKKYMWNGIQKQNMYNKQQKFITIGTQTTDQLL